MSSPVEPASGLNKGTWYLVGEKYQDFKKNQGGEEYKWPDKSTTSYGMLDFKSYVKRKFDT